MNKASMLPGDNPYVVGNPVGDSAAFVGREDLLRAVARSLRQPGSTGSTVVLYGQRRIGKTSLLQQLAAYLPGEAFLPVYFDLQGKAESSIEQVLAHLTEAIAQAAGCAPASPTTDFASYFREEWLPGVLSQLLGGCSLVLLFDEFDVLADPTSRLAGKSLFPYLQDLIGSLTDRLRFVFVIGRSIEDLSDRQALALFKGAPTMRVSLLSREETTRLVRLSEQNDSLHWQSEAVDAVWALTTGSPILVQQVCYHVWERAHDEASGPVEVTPQHVRAVEKDVIDASQGIFEWLWDGLGFSERLAACVLAAAGNEPISKDRLDQLLMDAGVRRTVRDLEDAPRLLREWDILESHAQGYRFRVELLRRWIADHKPLSRVQNEMDKSEPLADSLCEAADRLYQTGRADEAVPLLRQALDANPEHAKANELLADIYIESGQWDEAQELLERVYESQPATYKARLCKVLLHRIETSSDADEKLALCGRVLSMQPNHTEALAVREAIWMERGDKALSEDDLRGAAEAYRQAGNTAKVSEVEQLLVRLDLEKALSELHDMESPGRYDDALEYARSLATKYPDQMDWGAELDRLGSQARLDGLYQGALGAVADGDRRGALNLLAQVIELDAEYRDASRYLCHLVTGADVLPSDMPTTPLPGAATSRSGAGKTVALVILSVLLAASLFGHMVQLGIARHLGSQLEQKTKELAYVAALHEEQTSKAETLQSQLAEEMSKAEALESRLAEETDRANSLQAQIDKSLVSVVVGVQGNLEWQSTGVQAMAGQLLSIEYVDGLWGWNGVDSTNATGTSVYPLDWPDNVLTGCRHATLLARVGDGAPICVSDHYSGVPDGSGEVQLRINDTVLTDNFGAVQVLLQIR